MEWRGWFAAQHVHQERRHQWRGAFQGTTGPATRIGADAAAERSAIWASSRQLDGWPLTTISMSLMVRAADRALVMLASMSVERSRSVALVTGASRQRGIASAIAVHLAADGWDVATTYWRRYDERMTWGSDADDVARLDVRLRQAGAATAAFEMDLADASTPEHLFAAVEARLGHVTALVLAHAESVDSGILDTTLDSFDRHFAVNARATWLLIREFARRLPSSAGGGRIVGLTSDHVAGNLAYGASKGALDRIVLAAAEELGPAGVSANVVNPGPTDTDWMTRAQLSEFARRSPLGRVGTPDDCANLVSFLCSSRGGWITGQLLHSNGGWR